MKYCNVLTLAFSLLIVSIAPPSVYAADVDDTKVKSWITASITGKSRPARSLLDSALSKRYDKAVLHNAWRKLKACRDAGNSEDLNLAAAEHYLFARNAANNSGDTTYRELPKFYETIKSFAKKHELESYLQSSDQPLSKVNAEVTGWGEKGVEDGLLDYEFREKKEPSAKSFSTMTAVLSGYVIYSGYGGSSSSSCAVRI